MYDTCYKLGHSMYLFSVFCIHVGKTSKLMSLWLTVDCGEVLTWFFYLILLLCWSMVHFHALKRGLQRNCTMLLLHAVETTAPMIHVLILIVQYITSVVINFLYLMRTTLICNKFSCYQLIFLCMQFSKKKIP